jgi:hypothetical protein
MRVRHPRDHAPQLKRRYLTAQDAEAAPAPDLLGRDFIAPKPGTKPIGGIAYPPTIEGR